MSTHEVTTPNGTKVELKDYITGGDDEAIQAIVEDALSVDAGTDGQASTRISGAVVRQMRHKALEVVVVSVNGVKENVVPTLLELPREDYQLVVAEVNKVTEGNPEKKD